MGMTLEKVAEKAPEILSLAKTANTSVLDAGLNGQVAKVALILDYSGSMRDDYKNGSMQRLTEKVLALATQLDDDGSVEFFVFDTYADFLGNISLDDYKGSVDRLINGRRMGLTYYGQALLKVRDHFGFTRPASPEQPKKKGLFGFRKEQPAESSAPAPAEEPVYVLFLTDGGPSDPREAVQALTEVSSAPIFWKFLSIGEHIPFLQKLDDLTDRFMDNADYQPIQSVDTISDEELFKLLLVEYPEWLAEARTKGLIK